MLTGAACPCCHCGKLYELREPARWLRIVGQAPLAAICWDCQRLRCSTCGHVYTARAPDEAQGEKYAETAAGMLALLRYGTGMPFYRLDHLQRDLETPVPSSTQWDVLDQRVELVRPAYDELFRQAAQGSVMHNDDTFVRILELMGKRKAALLASGGFEDPERTGLFTTAIVSVAEGRPPIALFATGRKHAGENLTVLLEQRAADLGLPIHMCDALARNLPKGHEVIESNCLAHGRRKVVDEVETSPPSASTSSTCSAASTRSTSSASRRGCPPTSGYAVTSTTADP
jgi:transposase